MNLINLTRRQLLGVCITLLSLMNQACAPGIEQYYKPLNQGKTSARGCGGGPADQITIELQHGILIIADATPLNRDELYLDISFTIPSGYEMAFLTDEVIIRDHKTKLGSLHISGIQKLVSDSTGDHPEVTKQFRGAISIKLKPLDTMIGDTRPGFYRTSPVNYAWYDLIFRDPIRVKPKVIDIQLPKSRVNGALIDLPILKFERTRSVFIYALNC